MVPDLIKTAWNSTPAVAIFATKYVVYISGFMLEADPGAARDTSARHGGEARDRKSVV